MAKRLPKLPQIRVVCYAMDGEEISDSVITLDKRVLNKKLRPLDLFYILSSAGEKGSDLVTSAFESLMTRMGMLK